MHASYRHNNFSLTADSISRGVSGMMICSIIYEQYDKKGERDH